jgi:hypothetical protein
MFDERRADAGNGAREAAQAATLQGTSLNVQWEHNTVKIPAPQPQRSDISKQLH